LQDLTHNLYTVGSDRWHNTHFTVQHLLAPHPVSTIYNVNAAHQYVYLSPHITLNKLDGSNTLHLNKNVQVAGYVCVTEDGDRASIWNLLLGQWKGLASSNGPVEQIPFLKFFVFMTVKMWTVVFWVVCSSETSVTTCKTTGCHNPEDHGPHWYTFVFYLKTDKANLDLVIRTSFILWSHWIGILSFYVKTGTEPASQIPYIFFLSRLASAQRRYSHARRSS
jgi:hypothetical protein